MPQSSNLLSFVPVPNTELGPRLNNNNLEPAPVRFTPQESEEQSALRRIAEAALSATGASGAALALRRDGAVVCLARAGEMAPPLGAQLDDQSGISGECLRQGEALRCDDTEIDTRVDAEACRSLGLRSLAVAAIRDNGEVIGILEVFSPEPSKFNERHLEVLRQLAQLVVESVETEPKEAELQQELGAAHHGSTAETLLSTRLATTPLAAEESSNHSPALGAPVEVGTATGVERAKNAPATQLPGDVNIAAYMAAHEKAQTHVHPRLPKIVLIGLATVIVAALAGWYLDRRSSTNTAAAVAIAPPASTSSTAVTLPSAENLLPGNALTKPSPDVSRQPLTGQTAGPLGTDTARDSLTNASSLDRIANTARRVTKPIRVMRDEPASNAESDVAPGLAFGKSENKPNDLVSSLLNTPVTLPQRAPPISQGVEGGELESKVAAIYPQQARSMGQHGTVVLEALVGEDGSVRDVKVVSGPPLLRGAAIDAVRRWRYRPFRLNGHTIAAQTQVQLEFKLQ